jgi:hypothetical protein
MNNCLILDVVFYNLSFVRKCWGYNIEKKLYPAVHERELLTATGIGNVGASTSHKPMSLDGLLQR